MSAIAAFIGRLGGLRELLSMLTIMCLCGALFLASRMRNEAVTFGQRACSLVNQPKRDDACLNAIQALVTFERDALRASAATLAEAQRAREAKAAADLAASRAAAARTASVLSNLEKANAQVAGDHVGADWFGAVNDAAGLQPAR